MDVVFERTLENSRNFLVYKNHSRSQSLTDCLTTKFLPDPANAKLTALFFLVVKYDETAMTVVFAKNPNPKPAKTLNVRMVWYADTVNALKVSPILVNKHAVTETCRTVKYFKVAPVKIAVILPKKLVRFITSAMSDCSTLIESKKGPKSNPNTEKIAILIMLIRIPPNTTIQPYPPFGSSKITFDVSILIFFTLHLNLSSDTSRLKEIRN